MYVLKLRHIQTVIENGWTDRNVRYYLVLSNL